MNFRNIIGNTNVKEYLDKSINQNNILHSYLFLGTEGIGKLLIAKEFARKILCLENAKDETCTCKSCTCFNSQNHPDFHITDKNGDTWTDSFSLTVVKPSIEIVYHANEITDSVSNTYTINNGDGKINSGDSLIVRKQILGTYQILIR